MPKKILIIDDDADLLEAVSFLIEEAGYTTLLSVDGEIVSKLEEINPDLILIDQNLGSEDGTKLCKAIKENPQTNHFSVLILSGDENILELISACQANGFIKKPFVVKDLIMAIENHTNMA
ncbi:response regulator [Pedobacter frigidisoli]|uniref:Response regulator n=1 Tax=Pedobacter frigidisoli TaxID=2530455 RepID=A0A4R0NVR8_9SPHI|nr:response regulator [Pedobacter frigidisoli]TCD05601.1 response regulator [Pedobacter frigidisoli]